MRTLLIAIGTLLLGSIATSQQVQRPKTQFLRQGEDWSMLADVDRGATDDWLDIIKYVPLMQDDVWVSFGGHTRARWEDWNDFNFGMAPPGFDSDDNFLLTRVMVHGDLHVGENFRLFAEYKGAWSTDRDLPGGTRALDQDDSALQQLFVDYTLDLGGSESLTFRPGRQMFQFGKQRLVSPLPWANTLRTWDGISTNYRTGNWSTVSFYTQFVPVEKHEFNDPDHNNVFWGLYSARKSMDDAMQCDFYVLGQDRADVGFNGTGGDERRWTVGGRVGDKIDGGPIDFDTEAAYQFGDLGSEDISAFMFAGAVGYSFELAMLPSRAWVGFDYASGDDSPGGDVETFNQIFPLGHAYYGYIDAVGRQNAIDYSTGVSTKLTKDLTVAAAYHYLTLEDEDDALYNAGGGVSIPGGTSSDTEIGSEIDLTAKYKWGRHAAFEAGYSVLFAGDVPDDAGPGDDIHFFYLQAQYTF